MEQIRLIKEMRDYDRETNQHRGRDVRPRWMVWENVVGATSSNNGDDFRAVLEETLKVVKKDAVVPGPPSGKWPTAGCIMADGFSLAWRVHDAQYFGVAQRRRRICLLADFNGQSAPNVLFELRREATGAEIEQAIANSRNKSRSEVQTLCTSMSGNSESCGTPRENSASNSERSVRKSGEGINQEYSGKESKETLNADIGYNQESVVYGISPFHSKGMLSDNPNSGIYEAETARTLDLNGGNPACNQGGMAVIQNQPDTKVFTQNQREEVRDLGDVAASITAQKGSHQQNYIIQNENANTVCVEGNGSRESHLGDGYKESDIMYTLNTVEQHAVAYRKQGHPQTAEQGQGWEEAEVNDTLNSFDNGESRTPTVIVSKAVASNAQDARYNVGDIKDDLALVLENHPNDSRIKIKEDGIFQTLSSRMGTGGNNVPMVMEQKESVLPKDVASVPIVRRLTPLECTRLQGFPDYWVEIGEWVDSKGKKHKDSESPKYKALGNSVALPFWKYLAEKIVEQEKKDGKKNLTMGSLFSGIGGFEFVFTQCGCTPLWASEIEEFCIAVTKKHFGDEENGIKGDLDKFL